MNETIKVQANVNAQTVKNVNEILGKVGLTPTSAINALYHAIENQGQLPFQIGLTNRQKAEYGVSSNDDLRKIKMMHFVDELVYSLEPEDWWDVARSILLMHGYLYWKQHVPVSFDQIAAQLLKEYRLMTEEKFLNIVAKDFKSFNETVAIKSDDLMMNQAMIWRNILLQQLTDYYDANNELKNGSFATNENGLNEKQLVATRFVISKIYPLLKNNIDRTEYFVDNNML